MVPERLQQPSNKLNKLRLRIVIIMVLLLLRINLHKQHLVMVLNLNNKIILMLLPLLRKLMVNMTLNRCMELQPLEAMVLQLLELMVVLQTVQAMVLQQAVVVMAVPLREVMVLQRQDMVLQLQDMVLQLQGINKEPPLLPLLRMVIAMPQLLPHNLQLVLPPLLILLMDNPFPLMLNIINNNIVKKQFLVLIFFIDWF